MGGNKFKGFFFFFWETGKKFLKLISYKLRVLRTEWGKTKVTKN